MRQNEGEECRVRLCEWQKNAKACKDHGKKDKVKETCREWHSSTGHDVCACACECVLCTCVYLHACVCITEVSEHWSPLPNLPSCWSDTIMASTEVFNWELCVWSGWCYHLTQGLELDLLSLRRSAFLALALSLVHPSLRSCKNQRCHSAVKWLQGENEEEERKGRYTGYRGK